MREESANPDVALARVAASQHGVVTVTQLRNVGIEKSGVSRRLKAGRLHRIHRGVYAVGHRALSLEGRWMAAVLACGEGAVLSHVSAAVLWGLLRPFDGPIHVSVPSANARRPQRAIHLHRCITLGLGPPAQSSRHARGKRQSPFVTKRRGIPVTAVRRTVDDLRGTQAPRLVRRARRQAELAGWRLDRPRRPTRSDLEDDFLDFLRRHRLPPPEVNVKLGRREVDFLWRAQRVAVETDFFDYHRGSVAFEDDHQRDLELRRRGYTVLRYTGDQLHDHPAEVASDLGEVLARGPVPRRSRHPPPS